MSSNLEEWSDTVFYALLVVFPFVERFWEFYLRIRQLRVVEESSSIPDDIKDIMSTTAYNKSRSYTLDKLEYIIITSIFTLLNSVQNFGPVCFLGRWMDAILFAMSYGYTYEDEIAVSVSFMFLTNVWTILLDIPFAIYYNFVIERRYSFNNQSLVGFLFDRFKYLIITLLIVLPVTAAEVYVIKNGGDQFFLYLWIVLSLYAIALFNIIPTYIFPIFYSIKPLPAGPLKQSIEELALSQGFPLSRLYIMEHSSISTHSTAYFTGIFGFSQIVLYDTLLYKKDPVTGSESGLTDKEVLAVLCHELGHWKYGHIQTKIMITLLQIFGICAIHGYLISYKPLYDAVGFHTYYRPALIGLLAVKLLLAPLETICNFFVNRIITYQEYQADRFSAEVGFGNDLKRALCTIYKDNMIFPIYDWMYSLWYLDHPTLLQRIKFIDSIEHRR